MKMEKFCGCIRLQVGVFISVALSLTAWSGLLFTYIPYILLYSPMEINSEYENEEEALEMAMPGKDYGTGSVAPIIILMGVFVDTLLLAGTFKKYQIKTDLLVPWLFFYSMFSVALFAIAVLVGMYAHGVYKATCVVPAFMGVFYIYVWVCVLHLFKVEKITKNIVMQRLNSVAMEPLVAIAKKSLKDKESV